MMEHIIVYHESDLSSPIVVERAEFYENRLTLYREYFTSVVDVFIFDIAGNIILQRRAQHKKVSPGLLHTTVGGHINPHETVSFTLLHECIEEFWFPAYIVPDSMDFSQVYETLVPYLNRIIPLKSLRNWELEFTHSDRFGSYIARDKCHDFVGVFSGTPNNLDNEVESFETMTLEELDQKIEHTPDDFTRSFHTHYAELAVELRDFRDTVVSLWRKYIKTENTENQSDFNCIQKPKNTILSLIFNTVFMEKDMSKDACCTDKGMCKWFCPSVSGVVAGVIVISAGITKFLGGKAFLTAIGGMALGLVHVSGHSKVALILGGIAATIEVIGGISFAVGCRKTSRWAALALSAVMGVAVLVKLTHLETLTGGTFHKAAGLLAQIQIELLLFAVFFQKALRLMKACCGMSSGCCPMPAKK